VEGKHTNGVEDLHTHSYISATSVEMMMRMKFMATTVKLGASNIVTYPGGRTLQACIACTGS
jgi:hypothetical protein